MKLIIYVLLFTQSIFASTQISYDRNNIHLEKILNKITYSEAEISLKPYANQSQALLGIKNLDTVSIVASHVSTIDAIYKSNPTIATKYSVLAFLQEQSIHIAVRKGARFKTIYDLHKRNVNVGREANAMDLFANTLSTVFKLNFKNQYNHTQDALNNMIHNGGIDAVLFTDTVPSNLLLPYKDSIQLLNIPNIQGFKQRLIPKNAYAQSDDVMSIESDLILIATQKYIINNADAVQRLIENIFSSATIKGRTLCTKKYSLRTATRVAKECKKNIQVLDSNTPKQSLQRKPKKRGLNLVKKIETIEDIELYSYPLFKNKSFGKLTRAGELKKIKQLIHFYEEEKTLNKKTKLIIKSYSNTGNSYALAQKTFKILKKKGIPRSSMIIKSFNTQKKCNASMHVECKYIQTKILFEFL
ncbi:hypothetical protein JHD48_05850 [Sulfurimonas sp. SAG-AH-194-I05]|nr:TAXI family TRAP transporter solute-binding subunit [Sulfurimonas sp. SAG-AH-194-I05]MDF1875249.1 hypothetical protein [Sulfurimonas sp. SAG-AH-194-I05]